VEGQVAQVGEGRLVLEDSRGSSASLGAGRVVEVLAEDGEPLDPEGGEVLARDPRPRRDEHDRLPAAQLERLPEHPLELQLVDELGQADEQRDRPVAVADLA
jgi:hypothetical protein